jgi:hypothetical protein
MVMGVVFENVLVMPQTVAVGVGVGVRLDDGVVVGVGEELPGNVALKSLNCGPVELVASPAHIPARPAAVKTVLVTAILCVPFQRTEMEEPFMTSSIKPMLPGVSKSLPVRV